MFGRLAHMMYRRRRQVLVVWLVLLLAAGGLAAQVGSVLGTGSYTTPGSESAKATALLGSAFHQDDQRVTLVVLHQPRRTIRDAAFREVASVAAQRILADRALQVAYLDNPLASGNRQLLSTDGHSIAILFSSKLAESQLEGQIDHLRQITALPGMRVYVTGTAAQNHDSNVTSQQDLARGDAITVPIMIVILLLVFGTVVAAALPLVLAISSIVLSLAIVFLLGHVIDTVAYVTNMVTVLGLGIGIDYSLFILYRFREELRAHRGDVETAIVRTMETTGRAVFYSGVTVAIGISSLLLTRVSFMESMGLGGLLVPITALLVAMTLLPALLSMLGTRVNRLRVVPERLLHPSESGMWRVVALAIMRRPVLSGGAALAILLAITYPVTQLHFAFGSLKNEPISQNSVAGALFMQSHFPISSDPVQVIVRGQASGSLRQPAARDALRVFEQHIAKVPGVAQVVGPADDRASAAMGQHLSLDGQTALISVTSTFELGTTDAERLVRRLRDQAGLAMAGPLAGSTINVGGAQASYTDYNDALYARFPLIVGIVLALTYGFLFFAFRSVILPLKAVALNLLSVGAAYGLLQLIFQQGIGAGLLGFTPESGVAGWVPIFLFALLFGLSMDYEVFLLSRIRERWLSTGDTGESVIYGLQRTGRLITSAAAIMVVAFTGLVLGSEVQLKEMGFGLLASVAIDATLIRVVLVPAIMGLLGAWNWWVPSRLRGFASGGSSLDAEVAAPASSSAA